jgi:hypothetical protein
VEPPEVEPGQAEPDRSEPVTAERGAERRPVDRWRQTTASGAVAAAIALGLRNVFEPERTDTVAVEQEAPDEPADDERVELRFDPLNSRGTTVVVHPPPED